MLLAWNARLGWFSFGNRARLGQGKHLYRLVGDSGQEAVCAPSSDGTHAIQRTSVCVFSFATLPYCSLVGTASDGFAHAIIPLRSGTHPSIDLEWLGTIFFPQPVERSQHGTGADDAPLEAIFSRKVHQ